MKRFLLVLLIFMPWLAIDAQSQPSDVNRFGIVEGMWFPEITCDLGVGWERLIFDWAQHQPTSPEDWYTLNVDDRWLQAADRCNREVVALLKHTPQWATDGTAGVGVPRGLTLPIDDPENYWAQFVFRTVDYYQSRGVSHFIIWNEPDIDAETYGYEFEGTLDDYYQMVRVAYLAAKRANPSAVIHLAGTTYWHDVNEGRTPYMTRLVERILADPEAPDHDYYFDVLSLHIYFRTDSVFDLVHEMRMMLDSHGLQDKRIWINETNAAPTDDPEWQVSRPVFQLNLQHQSSFLVQSAVLGLAAGAERIAAYKLYDQLLPIGGESFGILNPATAQPRPAFYAWQMVVAHLNDVTEAIRVTSPTLTAVRMRHTNGTITLALWANSARSAQVTIQSATDKAYLLSETGTPTVIRPQAGNYALALSSALCEDGQGCYLGGSVRLFIHPDTNFVVQETTTSVVTLNFEQE